MLIGPDTFHQTLHFKYTLRKVVYLIFTVGILMRGLTDVQWLPLGSCWVSPYNVSRLDLEDHLTAVMITLCP